MSNTKIELILAVMLVVVIIVIISSCTGSPLGVGAQSDKVVPVIQVDMVVDDGLGGRYAIRFTDPETDRRCYVPWNGGGIWCESIPTGTK